jgi:hypothetical protein
MLCWNFGASGHASSVSWSTWSASSASWSASSALRIFWSASSASSASRRALCVVREWTPLTLEAPLWRQDERA